ncbi:hypothetical protein RND81_04G198500 [Saponaria officinalis]|uniref:Auxin-responsive protein n=1 Tax=Saponaria officinalis TaxID=3572 RepID=A0AAW1LFP2_SAPOF
MMTINFEETELRLGLPGGLNEDPSSKNNNGKRGFCETRIEVNDDTNVDLKLNLSSVITNNNNNIKNNNITINDSKAVDQVVGVKSGEPKLKDKVVVTSNKPTVDPAKPPSKAQVVGWPPVRSFRKNIVTVQRKTTDDETDQKANNNNNNNNNMTSNAAFVKVSMDGAPYLRKVDLKLYKSYQDLSNALAKMFSSFTIGNCGSQGMKDFMSESKLKDVLNGSEYAATYEDKDGDWMLVGDVPWPMFVESCKRLRIMKGSEAIGLAPRAVEKCKSRS